MSVERSLLRDRRGTSAVEFALVAPVLMAMMIGLIQLAWALHCGASVRWALESTARTLLVTPGVSQADLQSAVQTRLNGIGDPNNVTVTLVNDSSTSGVVLARATAVYKTSLSIPFVPLPALTFKSSVAVPVG